MLSPVFLPHIQIGYFSLAINLSPMNCSCCSSLLLQRLQAKRIDLSDQRARQCNQGIEQRDAVK